MTPVEIDFLSYFSKFRRIRIARKPRPGVFSQTDRAHHAIDAEKTHAA